MTIDISKMIVHKLNINNNLPILANECINIETLENNEEAQTFFKKHIKTSRNQGFVKKCQFWGLGDNLFQQNIEKITDALESPDKLDHVFIEETKKMAKRLASLIRGTSSKSDGSLFCIIYSEQGKNNIGIMKMDPDTGIEVLDDLTIVVREDMLPSKREKLHKAAFVECKKKFVEGECHVFTLDRQSSQDEPSKFFMDKFLNVKIIPDNENLTREIQKEMVAIFKEVLPKESFMMFNQNFKKRLQTGEFFTLEEDFPPLIRNLLPKKNRDSILDEYILEIQSKLVKRMPGEVTGFIPHKEGINESIYQSIDRSIKVTISAKADNDFFEKKIEKDGTFILKVYPEGQMDEIK